ncbi:MAG: hypothetical protein D3907_07310 [Candidatus Electrothrix sp. AUS3]|nr:hypothetical protein [Candidatus Electrothrix gigas]
MQIGTGETSIFCMSFLKFLLKGFIMNILSILGDVCSILSLIISFFIASKIINISVDNKTKNKVDGDENIVGRDINVSK